MNMKVTESTYYTVELNDQKYIRFGRNRWYKQSEHSLEPVADGLELDNMYAEYRLKNSKTIQEQGKEADEDAKNQSIHILTSVLAALEKENNIEKAVTYAVTTSVKRQHGFVEPISYDYDKFRTKAINAVNKLGSNYNPFVSTYYAYRTIK